MSILFSAWRVLSKIGQPRDSLNGMPDQPELNSNWD